jgi:hypothetical protein
MDDEAAIKLGAVIVGGVVLVVAILVFGIGWATGHGAPESEASASAQVDKTVIAGCMQLPAANQAACLNDVSQVPVRTKALEQCYELDVAVEDEQCIVNVSSGASLGGSTTNLRATAVVACDRIGTLPTSRNADVNIKQCVAAALKDPVGATSG